MQSLRFSHNKVTSEWKTLKNDNYIHNWMQLLLILLYFGLFVYFKNDEMKMKNIKRFCTLNEIMKEDETYFKYRMNLIKEWKLFKLYSNAVDLSGVKKKVVTLFIN